MNSQVRAPVSDVKYRWRLLHCNTGGCWEGTHKACAAELSCFCTFCNANKGKRNWRVNIFLPAIPYVLPMALFAFTTAINQLCHGDPGDTRLRSGINAINVWYPKFLSIERASSCTKLNLTFFVYLRNFLISLFLLQETVNEKRRSQCNYISQMAF